MERSQGVPVLENIGPPADSLRSLSPTGAQGPPLLPSASSSAPERCPRRVSPLPSRGRRESPGHPRGPATSAGEHGPAAGVGAPGTRRPRRPSAAPRVCAPTPRGHPLLSLAIFPVGPPGAPLPSVPEPRLSRWHVFVLQPDSHLKAEGRTSATLATGAVSDGRSLSSRPRLTSSRSFQLQPATSRGFPTTHGPARPRPFSARLLTLLAGGVYLWSVGRVRPGNTTGGFRTQDLRGGNVSHS